MDMDISPGLQDERDRMRVEDFTSLMEFFLMYNTLKVSQEDVIMEVFNYFVNRDMILEASTMQPFQEVIENDTLIPEEEEVTREDMDTEYFLHNNLEFGILSDAELFHKNYEGKESKDVWTAFDIFETNSIDMSKLDNLVFQKKQGL